MAPMKLQASFLWGGYLNLNTGNWVPYDNDGIRWFYTWTPTGKVDGKDETLEEQQKKRSHI